MQSTRRRAIKITGALATLVSLGILTQAQAHAAVAQEGFQAKTLQDALKALGARAVTSDQVTLVSPDFAENGAAVAVSATSRLPNTTEMYFLVEKNPAPLSAAFIMPPGTEADIQTRLKMAQSSRVLVVVKADGKLYWASKETKVTLGSCGG